MKWKYETLKQQRERLSLWHPWFAWHPVWATSGDAFWLQVIDRRQIAFLFDWYWEYREMSANDRGDV